MLNAMIMGYVIGFGKRGFQLFSFGPFSEVLVSLQSFQVMWSNIVGPQEDHRMVRPVLSVLLALHSDLLHPQIRP